MLISRPANRTPCRAWNSQNDVNAPSLRFTLAWAVRQMIDKIPAHIRGTCNRRFEDVLSRLRLIMRGGWASYFEHAVCKHVVRKLRAVDARLPLGPITGHSAPAGWISAGVRQVKQDVATSAVPACVWPAEVASRDCQSLAASSRDSEASDAGRLIDPSHFGGPL